MSDFKPRAKKTGSDEADTEKLQKVLANAGFGSRRALEREISEGKVTINGKVATLGDRVKAGDSIEYQGRRIKAQLESTEDLRVILYNKPEGQICSRKDPEGRPSVFDNLPRLKGGRWIAVGRLDFNTSGALLFTNNGNLANKLMHPSSNVDREYLVRTFGDINNDKLQQLRDGVQLDDGPAKFTDIKPSPNNDDEDSRHQWFYCVVMEGRNREVRKLWEAVGVQVSRLKRVRYGNIFIPSHVRAGQWIELDYREISDLCQTAGLPPPRKMKFSKSADDARKRHIERLKAKSRKKQK